MEQDLLRGQSYLFLVASCPVFPRRAEVERRGIQLEGFFLRQNVKGMLVEKEGLLGAFFVSLS